MKQNHPRITIKLSLIGTFLCSVIATPMHSTAQVAPEISVKKACTSAEQWKHPSKWIHEYQSFVIGSASPMTGFSEALQLKRLSMIMSNSTFERDFAEYWVGRVLFELKLDPIAHQAMASVFENSENLQIKKAALSCLGEIQKRATDLSVPPLHHPSMAMILDDAVAVKDAADAVLLSILKGVESKAFSFKTAAQLPTIHGQIAMGLALVAQRRYSEALPKLKAFTDNPTVATDPFLKTYLDPARLALGRSYYSVGKFKEAEAPFQAVTKTSNWVIDSMSDLSWAYFQNDRFDDVLGIALQLRVGPLKNTFVPEPAMVAAMVLNERCNFPDSVKMINMLSQDYAKSYEWLIQNKKPIDIYSEVIQMLKAPAPGEKPIVSAIPNKISGEWMKNPSFIQRQKEINLLIAHPAKLERIESDAVVEQDLTTQKIVNEISAFVKEVRIANLKLKQNQDLSDELANRYLVLKKKVRKLARFYRASKTWKILAKNYQKQIPRHRAHLVEKVNHDLNQHNQVLLGYLKRIKDNIELIEIEIYNGASQDMIWKNAHPDYDKMVKGLDDEKKSPAASEVWSWGRSIASDLDSAEVWEDEVGALKADVSDQCNQKDKYLKIRLNAKR